jgi:predicted restriction endonuclease
MEERVTIRYVTAPNLPLWLDGSEDPAVSALSVARARGGTVFNVTSDQWDSLVDAAGGWSPLAQQLERESREVDVKQPFDPTSIEDGRRRTLRQIAQRQGQRAFRKSLIQAYRGRCAITGTSVLQTLEAAHIYPYRGKETNDVTNGLLLRADLHTLFDLGLITLDTGSYSVLVAESLRDSAYWDLQGQAIELPVREEQRPSKEALDWHRAEAKL